MIRKPVLDGPGRTIVADFSKPSANRSFELKDVKWVIGYRWKQRFIGEVAGQEVVFPAQWSVKENKWQLSQHGARPLQAELDGTEHLLRELSRARQGSLREADVGEHC
jgi:hypothetical protein